MGIKAHTRIARNFIWILLAAIAAIFTACEKEISQIGGGLTDGEVNIYSDSLLCSNPNFSLNPVCVKLESIDGRNVTKLLGRINVPEYGSLKCAFVSQMLSATAMNIPDSIQDTDVDSIRLVLTVPLGSMTGDSLAPQQVKVFRLSEPLDRGILSTYDPAGKYYPDPMGQSTFTLSNIAGGDSAMKASSAIRIPVKFDVAFGRQIFNMYRNNDPVFEWPATFNEFFKGIYVEPSFGNGCIANIAKAEVFTYWHRMQQYQKLQPDSTYATAYRLHRDSICLMSSQPEVISSNIISLETSNLIDGMAAAGKAVITTPGGYEVKIKFPVERLIEKYLDNDKSISMPSALKLILPPSEISNEHGIGIAPWLLMVPTDKREEFFANNMVPDGKTSFYAAYDNATGSYDFTTLREYFIEKLAKYQSGEELTDIDTEFSIVPVSIVTEVSEQYNASTVFVTRCQPYLTKPTMTRLDTEAASIVFIYSRQDVD